MKCRLGMAIALEGRVKARREAQLHVQLELINLPAGCPESVVSIQGRITTVFRGQALARPGSVVEFPLWVCSSDNEPTGPAFVYYDRLMAATHMEAYLYGSPPKCKLAAYEFALIGGPSTTPVLSESDLVPSDTGQESAGRRRWWPLW